MVRKARVETEVTAEDKTAAARKSVETGFMNMIANVQSTLMQAGSALNTIGSKVTNATDSMVTGFAQFDQQVMNTRSIVQGVPEDIDKLREKAIDISKELPIAMDEAAKGFYGLASAGQSANIILESSEAITKLATATAADFAITANAVTAAVDLWGETGLTANMSTEILMNTVKGFKTTLPELVESLKFGGAIAAQLGVSYEDLATSIGLVRQQNIDASTTGTGLRMMFMQMIAPSGRATEIMEKYGIQLIKNSDGTLDYIATLRKVNDALADTEPVERAAVLTELYGARAEAVVSALLDNVDALEARSEAATRAGSVDAALAIQMEGAANKIQLSTNRVNAASDALGEKMVPATIAANEATAKFLENVSVLPEPLLEVGGAIAIMAGKTLTAIGSTIQLITAVTSLILLRKINASVTAAESASETVNAAAKSSNVVATAALAIATEAAVVSHWELASALAAETAAETVNVGAKVAQVAVTVTATRAQWALNTAMHAMPVMAVVGGAITLAYVYQEWQKETINVIATSDELQESLETTSTAFENQKDVVEDLQIGFDALTDYHSDLQENIEVLTLKNKIAQAGIDDLNEKLESESEEMRILQGEIDILISSQEEWETANRKSRLTIEQNDISIRKHEQTIKDEVATFTDLSDSITDASSALESFSAKSDDNSLSQAQNRLEIARLDLEMKPLLERRKELEDKQAKGIVLTGNEITELNDLTKTMEVLEGRVKTYADSNDELRITQMELSIDIQKSRKDIAKSEEDLATAIEAATADEVAAINVLKEENQIAADSIQDNVALINTANDERITKEEELANVVITLNAEEQQSYNELTAEMVLNNDAIDDNELLQAANQIQIIDTTNALDDETVALSALNDEFERFKEEGLTAEEAAFLVDAEEEGIVRRRSFIWDWLTGNLGEEEPPGLQSGLDFVPKEMQATLHPEEAVLDKEDATIWRSMKAGKPSFGAGGGGVVKEYHTAIEIPITIGNISHPDADRILDMLSSRIKPDIIQIVRDALRNDRIREGVS